MSEGELIERIRAVINEKPEWFLFREDEPVVSQDEVCEAANLARGELPSSFVVLQTEFGGGTFGFLELLSLSPKSSLFIWHAASEICSLYPNFLPINGDGCGGFYGFLRENTKFSDRIFYLDLESKPKFSDTGLNFEQFFIKFAFGEQVG